MYLPVPPDALAVTVTLEPFLTVAAEMSEMFVNGFFYTSIYFL